MDFLQNVLLPLATHVENFLSENCHIPSVSSIFKYNPDK